MGASISVGRDISKSLRFRRQSFDTKELARVIESGYLTGVRPDAHQQKTSFSPSKLGYGHGNCPRYWFFAFKGGEFKETTDALGVANMDNGTAAHERIQNAIEATGVLAEREVNVRMQDPPINGYADLMLNFQGERIVGEIKTTRQESFMIKQSSMKPSPNHLIQILIYMRATETRLGFLMYENKNTQEFLIIPIEMTSKNAEILESVLDWARTVRKSYLEDNLPNRTMTKKNKICRECPLSEMCDGFPAKTENKIDTLEVTV